MRKDVFNILRQRIVQLYYAPGEPINEKEIAEEFKVSRTPIREAFIRLSEENLVVSKPYSMTHVSDINFRDFQELIELRLALERAIARIVVRRVTKKDIQTLKELQNKLQKIENDEEKRDIDIEFHHTFWRIAGNKIMWKYLSITLNQFLRVRNLIETKSEIKAVDISMIIEALKLKDAAKVEKALVEHIEDFVELLRGHLSDLISINSD